MPRRPGSTAEIRRPRGGGWRWLLALLAALLLAGPSLADSAGMPPPQASAPRPPAAEEVRDSGSFHRAKVRILGIPVLTVASPVVDGSRGPDARQRAQVIEGNLELLYRSQEVCTSAESIGEQIVTTLLQRLSAGEKACDANQLGLLGSADQVRVEIAPGSDDVPVLQARVPGRELPLPLLSITSEDASLHGTTPQRLAERWRQRLERRLRLARHLLEPEVIGQRFRGVALAELALLGLLGLGLLLWRDISRRLMDVELEAVATATAHRKPEALSAAGSRAAQLPSLPGTHTTLPARRAETANLASPTPWSTPAPTSTPTPRPTPGSLATPLARPSLRDRARRWLRRFVGGEAGGLRRALAISGLHLLSRVLLGGVVLLVPLMVGVAVLAIPGQIPLAIALLLQPFGVVSKLAIGWLMALLLKTVLAVLLSQWQYNPVLAPERRARRDQRTRSLLRVSQRLVTVLCIALVALWVLVEIPGVQDLSNNALLASGALLGALALVFQDLLRDFVGGLVLLLEDRYAIGDAAPIRKEVRSGCRAQYLMDTTPSRKSWASAS